MVVKYKFTNIVYRGSYFYLVWKILLVPMLVPVFLFIWLLCVVLVLLQRSWFPLFTLYQAARRALVFILPVVLLLGMPVRDGASLGAGADPTVFYIAMMGLVGYVFRVYNCGYFLVMVSLLRLRFMLMWALVLLLAVSCVQPVVNTHILHSWSWLASWSSGHCFWLLIMRSQVRFLALSWGFFLDRGGSPW
jgi:hypothetical protein